MCRYGILVFTCVWVSAFGMLPSPINLIMDSVNFKNILRWDTSPDLRDNATYRVQYKLDLVKNKDDYKEVCVTTELYCDLTRVTYKSILRVRMEVNGSTFDWVTMNFYPDNETTLSAPEVKVSSRSGYLDVSFFGPNLDSGIKVKDKYGELLYRIEYWKELQPGHVTVINTPQNTDILNELDNWTTYCIKVQVYIPEYNKSGQFSPVICEKTTDDGRIATWKIAVLFLGSMLIAITVTLGLTYIILKVYKMTLYIFFPSYSIPQHLKEYLSKPFYSTPHLSTLPTEEHSESCEQLTFISEEQDETKENIS